MTWKVRPAAACFVNWPRKMFSFRFWNLESVPWTNAAVTRLEMLDPLRDGGSRGPLSRGDPAIFRRRTTTRACGNAGRWPGAAGRRCRSDVRSRCRDISPSFRTPGDHSVQVRFRTTRSRWIIGETDRDGAGYRFEFSASKVVREPPGTWRLLWSLDVWNVLSCNWEIAPESVLLERDLRGYDMIFLCNVRDFSREESALLQRYVGRGAVPRFSWAIRWTLPTIKRSSSHVHPRTIGLCFPTRSGTDRGRRTPL
jgi:hypothetical protein